MSVTNPRKSPYSNMKTGAGEISGISKAIICFKIKNPPTLHSTWKIQPTTSPTFVFSVFGSVRKTWGYEIKLLTVVLVVVHRVF
jgi:hypothetical protein